MLEKDPNKQSPGIDSDMDDFAELPLERDDEDDLSDELQELEIYFGSDSDSDSSENDTLVNRSFDESDAYYSDSYEYQERITYNCESEHEGDHEGDGDHAESAGEDIQKVEDQDCSDVGEVLFDPPLYLLRYRSVMDTLEQAQNAKIPVKTVVDLGCSECKFIKYFRNSFQMETEKIIGVDIDAGLLTNIQNQLKPLVSDYLNPRNHPFEIELLAGSVAHMDPRLFKVDAVCAIELIEHLQPDQLEAFPKTVFGFMQPNVVIITTPNKEYNVLFHNLNKEFRHPDHKFEWTRNEFKAWVDSILKDYPEYSVQYGGVGYPDLQPNPEGPCSQIAVFHRTLGSAYREAGDCEAVYRSVATHVYPVSQDTRSLQTKIFDEVTYVSRQVAMEMRDEDEYVYEQFIPVPVEQVVNFHSVQKLCQESENVIKVCQDFGMKIENDKILVELGEPVTRFCECFGSHQFDSENGVELDCPCFQTED